MMNTMLHTTLKELMVAERPLSSFSSAVKTGVAEAKGAKARITKAPAHFQFKGQQEIEHRRKYRRQTVANGQVLYDIAHLTFSTGQVYSHTQHQHSQKRVGISDDPSQGASGLIDHCCQRLNAVLVGCIDFNGDDSLTEQIAIRSFQLSDRVATIGYIGELHCASHI